MNLKEQIMEQLALKNPNAKIEFKKNLIKQMSVMSAIAGCFLGVLTIIPFICNFSFFTLIVLSAALMLTYMKKLNLIGNLSPQNGAIYGAIIGFMAFIGFSVSFMPLATLIGLIYKGSFYLGISLLFRSGFFVMIMIVFFVALLCALINAFSGMVTMYIHNQIDQANQTEQTNIDLQE